MGAQSFEETSKLPDVGEAFAELRDQAKWEYGHGGYSGTIAEKPGFTVFEVPAGHTTTELVAALYGVEYDPYDPVTWEPIVPAWFPSGIYKVWEDKWGPAVALRDGEGWTFCGTASS